MKDSRKKAIGVALIILNMVSLVVAVRRLMNDIEVLRNRKQ